ncbi:hypothetical protein BAUCODRAFT_129875 [Baudoinia panamericana UAMH 10762]|uniref:Sterol 24-C-methyltransferase n=1 Tax=Baudoinia panamericana (strain UAMH 10762) TaxID=717646 RepID=M2N2H5_BAUPA|nr:uncharacterized protein BAUCODRAFT_129875 [Baudoinia panamericana UAMH 10762]EMC98128.1 hypothetical protein BAUCODRAFT_129875 [Baudoinia panamericana UAMH 10762]
MSANPSLGRKGKLSDAKAAKSISHYSGRFTKWDDQTTVTEEERLRRQQTAAENAEAYYDFATIAKIHGWSTHLHYTPFAPHESIDQAMAHYAHRLAHLMNLRPGMKVLDVGCGVGGPAREIAKFAGCEVVGISINQLQLDLATEMTAQVGLGGRVTYVLGNFLELPFPAESFDAAYAIEATCHAPSLALVYAQVARVLKKGAVFGLSEWVMTPTYDAGDARHVGVRNRIERGNGISNLCSEAECRRALGVAGFEVDFEEDYAHHWDFLSREDQPRRAPFSGVEVPTDGMYAAKAHVPSVAIDPRPPVFRPWYYPLKGWTSMTVTRQDWWVVFRLTPVARFLWFWFCVGMVRVGVMHKDLIGAMREMQYCVDSVVEGGEMDIFSPCWFYVGRKVKGVDEGAIEGKKKRLEGVEGLSEGKGAKEE